MVVGFQLKNESISPLTTNAQELSIDNLTFTGVIPKSLRGTLFRIGPGLFSRSGENKQLFEGDGVVRSYSFNENNLINFKQKFIKTKGYLEENKKNKFIYKTLGSKGLSKKSLGLKIKNVSNINLYCDQQSLYSLDEMQNPYQIDAKTLETTNECNWGKPVMAHYKVCPLTQEPHFLNINFWPRTNLKIGVLRNEKMSFSDPIALPTTGYFHDWFITENYYVFILPPLQIQLLKALALPIGIFSYAETLKYFPNKSAKLIIVDRKKNKILKQKNIPATWLWHTISANEHENGVKLRFIETNFTFNVTANNLHKNDLSKIKEINWNLISNEIQNEVLFQDELIDFPDSIKDSDSFCFLSGQHKQGFTNIVVYQKGKFFKSEPRSKLLMGPTSVLIQNENYILVEAYDYQSSQSSLLIYQIEDQLNLKAEVYLNNAIPFSLHGCWSPSAKA